MRPIQTFLRLSGSDRFVLLHALAVTVFVRSALWVMPLESVRRILRPRGPVSPALQCVPVSRMAWAVRAAARRVPAASCLTQALVLQNLLARAGKTSGVRIGTAKDPVRGFLSHAWVEYRGETILGDNGELDRYSPILAL